MARSSYPTPVPFGFFNLGESALVGILLAIWLKAHPYAPIVVIGGGVGVACAYYLLLEFAGRQSWIGAPMLILSVIIWAYAGWNLGDFAFRTLGGHIGSSMLDSVTAWKGLVALLFAAIAFTDKASVMGHS